jgi:cephalosporin hydroxylase
MSDEALRHDVRAFVSELRRKIEERQHGVGTFADHVWLAFATHLEHRDDRQQWDPALAKLDEIDREAFERLRQLLSRRAQGRFVDHADRARTAGIHGPSDIGYFDMATSQGLTECLQWKGMPLFKSVYDFSLYPMLLWTLRPKTIVELGSGSGASALWLADTAAAFGLDTHVYSVDLKRPALQDPRITFLEGDCEAIDTVFEEATLRRASHPWLLLEDAHAGVYEVLRFFHAYLVPGDYVIVEDSAGKQEELRHFLVRHPDTYRVDTHYTDFFGRNATCAQDSILVRTGRHD